MIKRYRYDFKSGIVADSDGGFVGYADYAALAEQVRQLTEQRDAVVSENVALTLAIPEPRNVEFNNDSMDDVSLAEDVRFNDAIGLMKINMTKTPATSAILDSLRVEATAEGMEMVLEMLGTLAKQGEEYNGYEPNVSASTVVKATIKHISQHVATVARQLRESKGAQS